MNLMPTSVYGYIYQNAFRSQVIVVLLTLALLPLSTVPLELQRRMLDDAIAKSDTELLINLGLLYVGALLLSAAFKLGMRTQRELISARIVHSLRSSVYYCLYTIVPVCKWKREGSDRIDEGAVVSMLSSEVEKLGAFSGAAVSGPLLQIGTLVFVLGYMFWVEPVVAALALALYSPQFVIVPLFQVRLNRLARKKAMKVRELGAFIVDNAESELIGRDIPASYTSITGQILDLRKRFVLTKNVMKTLNNMLIALGPFGVIALGGWLAIRGEVEIGVIFAFVSGLQRLGGPIRELVASYSQITDARMRYGMLLDAFPDHQPQPA